MPTLSGLVKFTALLIALAEGLEDDVAYVAGLWPLQQFGMVAHECLGLMQYWYQHRCHCQMPWQMVEPQS